MKKLILYLLILPFIANANETKKDKYSYFKQLEKEGESSDLYKQMNQKSRFSSDFESKEQSELIKDKEQKR